MYLSCKNRSKQKLEISVYISKSSIARYFQIVPNMLGLMTEICYSDPFFSLVDIYRPVRVINCHKANSALFLNFFCFIMNKYE